MRSLVWIVKCEMSRVQQVQWSGEQMKIKGWRSERQEGSHLHGGHQPVAAPANPEADEAAKKLGAGVGVGPSPGVLCTERPGEKEEPARDRTGCAEQQGGSWEGTASLNRREKKGLQGDSVSGLPPPQMRHPSAHVGVGRSGASGDPDQAHFEAGGWAGARGSGRWGAWGGHTRTGH